MICGRFRNGIETKDLCKNEVSKKICLPPNRLEKVWRTSCKRTGIPSTDGLFPAQKEIGKADGKLPIVVTSIKFIARNPSNRIQREQSLWQFEKLFQDPMKETFQIRVKERFQRDRKIVFSGTGKMKAWLGRKIGKRSEALKNKKRHGMDGKKKSGRS